MIEHEVQGLQGGPACRRGQEAASGQARLKGLEDEDATLCFLGEDTGVT